MHQRLNLTALIVDEYDTAISFFVDKLGFELRDDTALADGKRWVVVAPHGGVSGLLLARAVGIGNVKRSAIRAEVECSCFSKRMTSPVTTSRTRSGVSASSKRLAMNHMASWLSSRISMATDGI